MAATINRLPKQRFARDIKPQQRFAALVRKLILSEKWSP